MSGKLVHLPAVTDTLPMQQADVSLICGCITSLITSLPGELRLAPHAPSLGWHALLLLLLLILLF